MAGEGKKAVVQALAGSALLTAIKSGAYMVSGSNAMFAEAIHSLADTANQTLLLIGLSSSTRRETTRHPFGFGKDRFVWALLSAAGIFFLGCGVTMTHGVHALLGDAHLEPPGWEVWTVLSISFAIDLYVLVGALRHLNAQRGDKGWMEHLRTTEDTTTVAVVFEDGAATFGVALAALGIMATHYLGIAWADAAATIIIGLLMGFIALFLVRQNRTYLIDRAVGADVQRRILDIIRGRHPSVENIFEIKTRVVGAGIMSFTAEIEFDGAILSERVVKRLDLREELAKLETPEDLDRLLDEHARIVVDELGNEIDRIEEAVREQIPGATFIALEVD